MPLVESSSSDRYDFSPVPSLSDTPKIYDSRGISYDEYLPRKQLGMIPNITIQGITPVIHFIEKDGIPRDLEWAIEKINTMLSGHMKYDAINYLLGQNIDKRIESYTAVIDPKKIGLSQKQIDMVRQQIANFKNTYPDIAEIPDLEKKMETLEGIQNLLEGPDGILLSKLLYADEKYTKAHHQSYNASIATILKEGVGQCHTFSALTKLILEFGNIRWKLGIRKVTLMSSPSGDHTVLEVQKRDGTKIMHDPTSNFTLPAAPIEWSDTSQKKSP